MNKEKTFMIQELREIPAILISENEGHTALLQNIAIKVQDKIPVICGMGSSYFLSEFGVFFLKHIAGAPNAYCVEADELMSQIPDLWKDHAVFGLSQSGSSKETVSAIKEANSAWSFTCAFHNKEGSSCQSISQLSIFQNIGTEKSPVSTKYITFQLVLLYKLAIFLWKIRWNITEAKEKELLQDVNALAEWITYIFQQLESHIKNLADSFNWNKFVVVWSWINAYSAQEIALKIRETTWLHATHDTQGILKHWGINSLWEEVCCILFNGSSTIKNDLESRWCKVISFGNQWNHDVLVPHVNSYLDDWLIMIAWQLFVHYLSCRLGIDTDIKNW